MRLDDYVVPRTELTVDISFSIDNEPLSGETSSTASAHKGIKPKDINVSLTIRKSEPSALASLVATAQQKNDDGSLKIFDIVYEAANAINIRQVYFNGTVSILEDFSLKVWLVRFRLREHLSVPEKIEARQEFKTTNSITQNSDSGSSSINVEQEPSQQLTAFEKVLKFIDDALADEIK